MDPERPIEKLLRQAAQARRTQAGTQELHPANRRMLQGEIARKFASTAPAKRSFFESFMPRLAWAATVIVGLGLAASLMLPRQKAKQSEMFFAKNDRVSTQKTLNESLSPAASAAKPGAPTEAPALARTDLAQVERDKDTPSLEQRRTERKQLALNEPTAAAPAVTSVGGSLGGEKKKEALAANSLSAAPPQTPAPEGEMLRRSYGLAVPAQPVPATAPAVQGGVGAEAKSADQVAQGTLAYKSAASSAAPTSSSLAVKLNDAAASAMDSAKRSPAPIARVSQQFVQTGALNKDEELADKSTVTKRVLLSFELQQLGREVRVIDSDGSIYSGSFQTPQALTYLDSAAQQKAPVTRSLQVPRTDHGVNLNSASEIDAERQRGLSDSKLQADLSYAFSVTGTNQTLNQIVIFTGQVLAPTNALSLVGTAGTLNGNRAAPPELNPLPLQNSRIAGRALIGTNKEVEVNAIPSH